jgi:hypothetical protein
MRLKATFSTIFALAITFSAAEVFSQEIRAQADQSVTNEDGGRAFIIEKKSQATFSRTGRAVSEPQQYSLFLGSGWTAPSVRARQSQLGNLLVNISDQLTISALAHRGIKSRFGPTFSREKLDQPGEKVRDLDIQALLEALLKDGTLPRPNQATIYVVFLAPEIQSSLGTMTAGKHYAAYHNFYNAGGARLHYVVVPFEEDSDFAYQIALRAFIAAALNP